MSSLPLVSISCITFNHSNYLRECFEGFLMQKTNFNFEVLVNDDASTDGTKAIIEEYTQKYPDIFFPIYQSENQYSKGVRGMMVKFNFPRARGKYIALCEGDDYWTDPYKLQKQVDFLEANEEYSCCFHDALVLNNNIESHLYVNKDKDDFTTIDLFERHFIPTASIIFRNSVQYPDWSSKIQSGDKLLLFMISLKGKIKFLNEVMSIYRWHEAGVSNTHFGIRKVYDSALLINLFDEYTNFKFTKECHESLLYEIDIHLNSSIKTNKLSNFKIIELLKEILRRIKRKIKKL